MPALRPFNGITPRLGERVFIDPACTVIGDVHIGDNVMDYPAFGGQVPARTVHHKGGKNLEAFLGLYGVEHDDPGTVRQAGGYCMRPGHGVKGYPLGVASADARPCPGLLGPRRTAAPGRRPARGSRRTPARGTRADARARSRESARPVS